MTDYRGDGPNTTGAGYTDTGARRVDVGPDHYSTERRRGGAGRWLLILLALGALIAPILHASGFWRTPTTASLTPPDIPLSLNGGELPDADVDPKAVVVGTKEETIEVPKIETEKEKVDVPTVGVTEGTSDKDGADKN